MSLDMLGPSLPKTSQISEIEFASAGKTGWVCCLRSVRQDSVGFEVRSMRGAQLPRRWTNRGLPGGDTKRHTSMRQSSMRSKRSNRRPTNGRTVARQWNPAKARGESWKIPRFCWNREAHDCSVGLAKYQHCNRGQTAWSQPLFRQARNSWRYLVTEGVPVLSCGKEPGGSPVRGIKEKSIDSCKNPG